MNHRVNLDTALQALQQLLLAMGAEVNKSIARAIDSLEKCDLVVADQIIHSDSDINLMEEQIMELGAKIIATQQPIAKDMRKILIAFRIANDLERIADLAVDIAEVTISIGEEKEEFTMPLMDIPRLGEIAQDMLGESMEAYVEENVQLAYEMAKKDDEADEMYSQILRKLFLFMIDNPKTINQAMLLCFVGRYLERIADHATNIGEHVVYLVQGKRPDLN